MEGIFVELISQWGVMGLILAGIIYLIVEGIKAKRGQSSCSKQIQDSIKGLNSTVDRKFDDVNDRIDLVNKKVDSQYNILNQRIDHTPAAIMDQINASKSADEEEHFNKVVEQFEHAPKLHKILKLYRERINCDHIFFGTFHNGSTSINGIPYCKFDIVAEKFRPGYNNLDNREFAVIYKDSDVLVHDNLPLMISQSEHVYFRINEDNSSELEEVDDILYRRCVKYGVKQFAANLIRDNKHNPMGFVGCVDFDYDKLNFHELNNCAHELSEIYK